MESATLTTRLQAADAAALQQLLREQARHVPPAAAAAADAVVLLLLRLSPLLDREVGAHTTALSLSMAALPFSPPPPPLSPPPPPPSPSSPSVLAAHGQRDAAAQQHVVSCLYALQGLDAPLLQASAPAASPPPGAVAPLWRVLRPLVDGTVEWAANADAVLCAVLEPPRQLACLACYVDAIAADTVAMEAEGKEAPGAAAAGAAAAALRRLHAFRASVATCQSTGLSPAGLCVWSRRPRAELLALAAVAAVVAAHRRAGPLLSALYGTPQNLSEHPLLLSSGMTALELTSLARNHLSVSLSLSRRISPLSLSLSLSKRTNRTNLPNKVSSIVYWNCLCRNSHESYLETLSRITLSKRTPSRMTSLSSLSERPLLSLKHCSSGWWISQLLHLLRRYLTIPGHWYRAAARLWQRRDGGGI